MIESLPKCLMSQAQNGTPSLLFLSSQSSPIFHALVSLGEARAALPGLLWGLAFPTPLCQSGQRLSTLELPGVGTVP